MYSISRNDAFLLIKFIDDFDFPMFQTALSHLTTLGEYADCNDIWLIGDNHADVCLGEIDLMVREFHCRCPRDSKRTRTAVVVDEGLTGAKIELWVNALRHRVAFEVELFRTLEEAQQWIEEDEVRVA